MSTTSKGNAFRDEVASLLRTQFEDAQTETSIDATDVDIVFTKVDFGTRSRIAVECKEYSSPLTKSQLSAEIATKYLLMLHKRSVAQVMVVSRFALGSDAQTFVDSTPGLVHRTYDQLVEDLIGCRAYVQGLARLKPTTDDEYIEARFEKETRSARIVIDDWVDQKSKHGLAILGGYGQGKTSFAERLAAEYAAQYLADSSRRIPVLVRLGEVVHETELSGLFGKEFTDKYTLRGYNYSIFKHLNRQGRLLIVLDGFDEMKHAMSSADFIANFKEFNKLLEGDAKVILLGRPNALPSDARDLVFRGVRKLDGVEIAAATFPEWPQIQLALFNTSETNQLMQLRLRSLTQKYASDGRFEYPDSYVENRMAEVLQKVPHDLLKRPVHVALVANLAADPAFDFAGFNLYRLYSHFIREMISRDTQDKPARRKIGDDARLTFQRELAWWAWTRAGENQGHFSRDALPASLLAQLPAGQASDAEGKLNEYIVSTLTEAKQSGVLFFAHRSFQEFLVAERMIVNSPTPAMHVEYSRFCNPEVAEFLLLAPDQSFWQAWFDSLLLSRGPISLSYFSLFQNKGFGAVQGQMIATDARRKAHSAASAGVAYWELTHGLQLHESHFSLAVRTIVDGEEIAALLSCVLALHLATMPKQGALSSRVVAAFLERCLKRSISPNPDAHELTIAADEDDFFSKWVRAHVLKSKDSLAGFATGLVDGIKSELIERQRYLVESSGDQHIWTELAEVTSKQRTHDKEVVYRHLPKDIVDKHYKFLRGGRTKFQIVPVSIRNQRTVLSDL